MKFRNDIADLLKGIGVLLMIQVHIVELFASTDVLYGSIAKVCLFLGGPPVAPIFMVIFGYYVFSSNKSTFQLLVRGLKIVVLGLLLNLALNFNLIMSVYQEKLQVDIWLYIFGVDILQFAGLSLIVFAVLRKLIQKNILFIFILMFISVIVGSYLLHYIPTNKSLQYITAFLYGSANWSYFPLFPWLAYPLAGIALSQLQQRYDFSFFYLPKTKLFIGFLSILFMLLTFYYALSITSNLPLYYHHGILFFIWVIIFLALYSLLMHQLNKWIGETLILKYFKWLGQNVTLIYATQWILIGNIATEIYKTVSSPLYLMCWFLFILIITTCLVHLILMIKEKWVNKK